MSKKTTWTVYYGARRPTPLDGYPTSREFDDLTRAWAFYERVKGYLGQYRVELVESTVIAEWRCPSPKR